MKSQILILILCLSYVMNAGLGFTTATGTCTENKFTFTITGTTEDTISSGSVDVQFSSNSIVSSCSTEEVIVQQIIRLRNLEEFNIECEISSELNEQKVTITQINVSGFNPVSNLNIEVNGGASISCGTTPNLPETEEHEEHEEPDELDELSPVTFGDLKVKAISVSQNSVVVAITLLQDGDENKRLSDNASIKNLKLVDNGSFNQDLTCTINKGSKLSSVICTMQTAATDGSKYKLSGTDVEFESEGEDEFGSVEIDNTEALAFTDDSENDTSSWLKNSIILFIYALLF